MLGARPESAVLTVTGASPAPAFWLAVLEPYAVVVPYSKCQDVLRPIGLTLPVTVAVVVPMLCAAPVETAGGPEVVNGGSLPSVVPEELWPTRRKWRPSRRRALRSLWRRWSLSFRS